MKSLTNEEYLALCQKLVDQQYDNAIDDYDVEKMEWIPAEPEIKHHIQQNVNGMIDLTHVKSSEIQKQIQLCTNFKVGKFKFRLNRYFDFLRNGTSTMSVQPPKNGEKYTMKFSMEVWEEKDRTPNGMPCKIDFPIALAKDNRFTGRPWLKHFTGNGSGRDLTIETVVEIVRWMQAVKKLTAFL